MSTPNTPKQDSAEPQQLNELVPGSAPPTNTSLLSPSLDESFDSATELPPNQLGRFQSPSSSVAGQDEFVLKYGDVRGASSGSGIQAEDSRSVSDREAYEIQVSQMQEDFAALCKDYKKQTSWYLKRLGELEKNLDQQKEAAEKSETHAIFLEDQCRFHLDQTKMVATYFQAQSSVKDDAIAILEGKLAESQASASSSQRVAEQEENCEKDRIEQLKIDYEKLESKRRDAESNLEASKLEVAGLQAVLKKQQDQLEKYRDDKDFPEGNQQAYVEQLEQDMSALRNQMQELEQLHRKFKDEHPAVPAWAHKCVWAEHVSLQQQQVEKLQTRIEESHQAYLRGQEQITWKEEEVDVLRRQLIESEWRLREEQKKRRKLKKQIQSSDAVIHNLRRRSASPDLRRQRQDMRDEVFGPSIVTSSPAVESVASDPPPPDSAPLPPPVLPDRPRSITPGQVLKDAFEQDDKRASVLDAVPVGDAAPSMPSESALEAAQEQKSYDELPSQDNVDESSISQSDMPKLEPKE